MCGCYASRLRLRPDMYGAVRSYAGGPMKNLLSRTNVLVLEDDAGDAILIRRAFTGQTCRAFICRNTSEARAYFLGSGMYSERPNSWPLASRIAPGQVARAIMYGWTRYQEFRPPARRVTVEWS